MIGASFKMPVIHIFFIFFDDFENGLLVASYSFKGPELGGSLPHGDGWVFL